MSEWVYFHFENDPPERTMADSDIPSLAALCFARLLLSFTSLAALVRYLSFPGDEAARDKTARSGHFLKLHHS
jgi:hypothetical protein